LLTLFNKQGICTAVANYAQARGSSHPSWLSNAFLSRRCKLFPAVSRRAQQGKRFIEQRVATSFGRGGQNQQNIAWWELGISMS